MFPRPVPAGAVRISVGFTRPTCECRAGRRCCGWRSRPALSVRRGETPDRPAHDVRSKSATLFRRTLSADRLPLGFVEHGGTREPGHIPVAAELQTDGRKHTHLLESQPLM